MKPTSFYLAIVFGILCCSLATVAFAQSELIVPLRSQDLPEKMKLGTVQVKDLGAVKLVAKRTGTHVIIHALGETGDVIGKADTFIGLTSTPIYVQGPSGLQKIEIFWRGKKKGNGKGK